MKINIMEKNGIRILQFDGEFSVFFQEEIEKNINDNIDVAKEKLVLDLSDVNYLDSSGISIIVTTAQRIRGKINLAGCQPNVKYVLELAEIDELVEFYNNIDDAVKALTK